jgi:hypothetical protein
MRSADWSNVLLKYNPDTNSTTEITDSTINPSSMSSDGINLYFTSNDDVYEFNIENQELVQIPAKNGSWGMDNFHSVGNKIFFNYFENQGEGDLFYYDRDTKETKLAKAINPNGDSRIEDMIVIKDKLYFTAKDITNYQENRDLMVYDTTNSTLSTLVENNATTAISQHSLVKYDDKLYYSYIVQQPSVNIEFREYNPETNTTKVIQGMESNNSLAQTSYGIEKDGTLFFVSAVGSKKQIFTYNSEDSSIVQDTNLSNIDMWLNTILNLGKPLLVIDTILADDINYSTNVGADPISFDLNESANIVSIDGATVEATIDTNGTKGDAIIDNNTVTYTPNSNVSGSDNFVIKLINSNNIKRLLNVTVNGIDTVPTDTNNDNNVSDNNTSNQEIISEKSYVIEALNSLKIGLLDNISLDTITSNISLPTTYSQSSVSWDSNNTSVIANNGTVTRPTVDTTVILVATITKGDYSYDKKFELKVLPTIDDNTSVLLTSNSLRVYDILGENKDSSHIYHNLVNPLPSSGIDSSTITWSSNKPQIIDNNGTLVSIPLVDTIVTMTATIVKNSEENNVSFPLIVKASNSTNSLENLLQLNGAITIDMLLGANRSPLSVVNNLNLDTNSSYYGFSNDITVSFESNNTDVVSNSGEVIRPNVDTKVNILATTVDSYNNKTYKNFEFNIVSDGENVIAATLKDSIIDNNQYQIRFEQSDENNLSSTVSKEFIFIPEQNANLITTVDGKESILDNSTSNSKIKEIKTLFANNGVVSNYIQVRNSADSLDTNIKTNILKSEILDANITRTDNGQVILKANLGTNATATIENDENGSITHTIKPSLDNSKITKIVSNLKGTQATILENGNSLLITPTLKITKSVGDINKSVGELDVYYKVKSDTDGTLTTNYSIQKDIGSSDTKSVNINIPSSIKGSTIIKDDTNVNSATDTFVTTQTLELNGRVGVVYTTPNGQTRTKFINTDGTNELNTSSTMLPFIPDDLKNLDIVLDTVEVNGTDTLRFSITSPLSGRITF